MGRVLLAALDAANLESYFTRVTLRPFTDRTVTSVSKLRHILDQVREHGWALVDQEVELGVRSVAAPIRDRSGQTIAAINISSHASRVNLKDMRVHHLPLVLQAAARISEMLGARTDANLHSVRSGFLPGTASGTRERRRVENPGIPGSMY